MAFVLEKTIRLVATRIMTNLKKKKQLQVYTAERKRYTACEATIVRLLPLLSSPYSHACENGFTNVRSRELLRTVNDEQIHHHSHTRSADDYASHY